MNNYPLGLGLFVGTCAVVAIVGVLTAVAWAIAPSPPRPVLSGPWIKLTFCSTAKTEAEHEAMLGRLSYSGELWVRIAAPVAIQDAPGLPGCSKVYGAQYSVYIKGTADDLVKVLR